MLCLQVRKPILVPLWFALGIPDVWPRLMGNQLHVIAQNLAQGNWDSNIKIYNSCPGLKWKTFCEIINVLLSREWTTKLEFDNNVKDFGMISVKFITTSSNAIMLLGSRQWFIICPIYIRMSSLHFVVHLGSKENECKIVDFQCIFK